MNDWYIDRSKNFLNDTFDSMISCFASLGVGEVETTVLLQNISEQGALGNASGNPNAALTRFRDHGLLGKNNGIGESALDYFNGQLSKGELIIDLFLKRPAKKKDSPNVKPFVLLCKMFDIMMEMSSDPDDVFITFAECYEYLYPCESYNDVTFELVERIITERQYELNSRHPISRVSLEDNEETNLSIWFNALKEAPVFMPQTDERQILTPNLRQREFFKFVSVNADEFLETPTTSNGDLYSYYCKRNTGFLEILPKVVKASATVENTTDIRILFEYLFGYKKDANFNYGQYLKYECFGIFFPFISLPRIAIRQILLSNTAIGEAMNVLLADGNSYLPLYEEGKFEYRGPFVEITHSDENDKEIECNPLKEKSYTVEELGKILFQMYSVANNKPASIHMFGIKYAEIIKENEYSIIEIINASGLATSYKEELRKGIKIYESILSNEYGIHFCEKKDNYKCEFDKMYDSNMPRNRIVFGAPGTGKSHTLNDDKNKLIEKGGDCERVTFHPDYSYANFVGTYKPVPYIDNEGKEAITYSYVPGPFIRTWVKAIKSLNSSEPKPYVLLIEEINRANAAAVFGDVFQLLDRDSNGISEYAIQTSEDLKKYLAKEFSCAEETFAEIKIPSNMFIWATMNSADQGVFPIDTAFKRRWDFTYIGIDKAQKGIESYSCTVNGKTLGWNDVRKSINAQLTKHGINEDKLIGPYFINEHILKDNEKFIDSFKSKLLMYLFEDAAKQRKEKVFFDKNAKYSDLCEKFDKEGIKVFHFDIWSKLIKEDDTE